MVARLSEVLEISVDKLLGAAGYPGPTADSPAQLTRPVRPRVSCLPLNALAPDRFEQFIADLAHGLYPDDQVSRFGGQGHKQHGVDVIVRRGRRLIATFQCKREREFGPAAVRKAVAAVTLEADSHFLMLTRPTASPPARQALRDHPKWTLRDGDDISRLVRLELSLESAVRLVDGYFPGWREDFLGIPSPGPWLTVDEYFAPFMGEQLFTHEWELVGRASELEAILKFVADPAQKMSVLVGRGGIGKTRILRAVASAVEATASHAVRFLSVAGQVRPEDFALLPVDPCLIIVDDAHQRGDVGELLAGVGRARPQAKVLLSARPYGWDDLTQSLRRIGIHHSSFMTWHVGDLTATAAETLAREVLGPDVAEAVVRRLAYLTTDCPLITVLGAGLLKRGQLDPAQLEGAEEVRADILHTFRDVLIDQGGVGDRAERRAVVDAVAILQPIRIDEPAFRTALEGLTNVPFDRAIMQIRSLEDSGLLLRRAQSLRIVPDMLGDAILADACFDNRSGISTGFVERTWKLAAGDAIDNVFINASRIDWQVRQGRRGAASIAETLWSGLEDEFHSAGNSERLALLKLVTKVSFYQPGRALSLARWALNNPPAEDQEATSLRARFSMPTHADLLRELPPLVKNCAYSLGHLKDSLDLLWALAQRDHRPANQHPQHALRALTDLAAFDAAKPIEFNEAIVSTIEHWFDGPNGPHSPFDVLEALLATEGSDEHADGFTLSFRPYALNVSAVRALRGRVVQTAFDEARHADLRRAVRAVQAIESSLHYPIGLFGRPVASQERDAWTPLFNDTIEQLGELAAEPSLDPVVGVAIRRALNWHARHSTGPTKQLALNGLGRLPTSREHELAVLLYDGWGRLVDHIEDHTAAERRLEARRQKLAEALAAEMSDDAVIELLCQRLDAQRRGFPPGDPSPGQFVWTLIGARPSLGEAMCRVIQDDPGSDLRDLLPVILTQMAQNRPSDTMRLVDGLLATGKVEVMRGVAQAFGWNRGLREGVLDGELELLRTFATHGDVGVRSSTVRAAELILGRHRAEAIDVLCRVRFSDAPSVAEDVLSAFGARSNLVWADLSPLQASSILGQLLACPTIEGYAVAAFLRDLSREAPEVALQLLRDRVERAEVDQVEGYQALPYIWHAELDIRSHPKFETLLRDLRDWIGSNPASWRRRWMGAEMFRAIAGTFDPPVILVLDEALESGVADQIETVGAILRKAPDDLVWENVPFVRRALNAAERHGVKCLRAVGGGLHSSVTSGTRAGTPGQPFPEDLNQRDRALNIANTLPPGSIEDRFYRSLVESAETQMRWSLDIDATLVDGRDW